MKNEAGQIEIKSYDRKTVIADLNKFCTFADKDDTIEMCEWINGEGYDVRIIHMGTRKDVDYSFTYGELLAMKKLFNKITKYDKKTDNKKESEILS